MTGPTNDSPIEWCLLRFAMMLVMLYDAIRSSRLDTPTLENAEVKTVCF